MTDIPASILAEARRIAECSLKPGIGCDVLEGSIARALRARDKRAAGIAEVQAKQGATAAQIAVAILADDGRKGC